MAKTKATNATSVPAADAKPDLSSAGQSSLPVPISEKENTSLNATASGGSDAASLARAPADRAADALANSTAHTATPAATPVFSWGGYFQALGLLAIILALLWVAVYFMRKHGKFPFMSTPGDFPRDGLRLEAQLPVGPRKGLMVVRFLNKRLLLGVTDQQITMLSEENTDNADVSREFDDFIKEARGRESDVG